MAEVSLSAMVICRNEAKRIGACLGSLSFCDEIVVIDSGSTDGTQAIVERSGARLINRAFSTWNDQKDFGRTACRGRWVLNIDADEVVSPTLREEVSKVAAGDEQVYAAFRIPFRNHLRDTWIRRSGFHPDRHVRLVDRSRAYWDRSSVHDRIVVDGPIGVLTGHIDHYSFESVEDYLEKSEMYATAFALHWNRIGRRPGWLEIIAHVAGCFVKSYVLQGGFREGSLGLTMSGLKAGGVLEKYLRLWELGREDRERAE